MDAMKLDWKINTERSLSFGPETNYLVRFVSQIRPKTNIQSTAGRHPDPLPFSSLAAPLQYLTDREKNPESVSYNPRRRLSCVNLARSIVARAGRRIGLLLRNGVNRVNNCSM